MLNSFVLFITLKLNRPLQIKSHINRLIFSGRLWNFSSSVSYPACTGQCFSIHCKKTLTGTYYTEACILICISFIWILNFKRFCLLLQESHTHSTLGQWLGWLMAAIYMGGRLPQIWLNVSLFIINFFTEQYILNFI